MRFRIEEPFWELFPDARIGVVVVRGVDNAAGAAAARTALGEAASEAAASLGEADVAAHPTVAPWREAYRAFGAKPSKYRSSIEGLLRSARGGGVRSVNPLVDLYNAVSLRFLVPCGGEDLAAVRGDVLLTRAVGDEAFVPLGSDESQPPAPGEVIYRDDLGVICRNWNWREAERTKLTATTRDAVLVLEALPSTAEGHLRAACDDLAAAVRGHLGGHAGVALLDAASPTAPLDG